MVMYIKELNWDVVNGLAQRAGHDWIISLLFDAEKRVFMAVPEGITHLDFVAKILDVKRAQLRSDESAKKFIPVVIALDDGKKFITKVLTGLSSLEIGMRVVHKKEHIKLAHRAAIILIKRGEIPISIKFKGEVSYKFAE